MTKQNKEYLPLAKKMIAMKASDWKFIRAMLTPAQIAAMTARGVLVQHIDFGAYAKERS